MLDARVVDACRHPFSPEKYQLNTQERDVTKLSEEAARKRCMVVRIVV